MLKGILVLSRERAEAYQPEPGEVCISITSPDAPLANLRPGWADVLPLQFVDDCWVQRPGGDRGITPAQALEAVAFFRRHLQAPRVVIHCEAGVSRSASMADALAWCFWCRHLIMPTPVCNPNVFVAIIDAFRGTAPIAPELRRRVLQEAQRDAEAAATFGASERDVSDA